jgi:branched-chain amino acid transport system ATP-binding protein
MTLLSLVNVEANYGAVRALRGVSLAIEEGAVVALLGANGAGKSTTLKCISGVVETRAGAIEFEGRRLSGLSPEQIVRLGIAQVPEGRKIFKDLTVLENLRMGAYLRSARKEIARDLDFVYSLFPRLRERAGQRGGALSGGEQQMLAIGRAFMARPKLLLLDEPSLGLAPLIVSNIFETLLSVNREQGTALLVVEQNARIALKNARFGYVMQLGRIVVKGPCETLREEKEVLNSYLGTQN